MELEQPTFASLDNMGVLGFTPRFEFNVTMMRGAPNVALMTVKQFVPRGEYEAHLVSYRTVHGDPVDIEKNLMFVSNVAYDPAVSDVSGCFYMTYGYTMARAIYCAVKLVISLDRDLNPGDAVEFRLRPGVDAVWWRPVEDRPYPADGASFTHWTPNKKRAELSPVPILTTAVMALPAGDYALETLVHDDFMRGGEVVVPERPRAKIVQVSSEVPLADCHEEAVGYFEKLDHDQRVGVHSILELVYVRVPEGYTFTVDGYRDVSFDGMHVFMVKTTGPGWRKVFEVYDVVEMDMGERYVYGCAKEPCYRRAARM